MKKTSEKEKEFCALIMAGGRGTRFWPKSTEDKPKQFLNLVGKKTMIQDTFDRISKKISKNKIFVVTSQRYENILKEQLPELPENNIIIEPVGRNTAPCILLACLYINQIYKNANVVVLPSDHLISNVKEFCNVLEVANEYISKQSDSIVTIGVEPNRPEVGYGYIKCSENKQNINDYEIIKVERFVEKPNEELAKEYVKSKKYLWNSGMFIFNIVYMIEEMKRNAKNIYHLLIKLPEINSKNYRAELERIYTECEDISIDYAIMEKSDNICVIPCKFGWDDIGTWKALQRYIDTDVESNIVKGNVKTYNSHNNVIYSEEKELILIDVDDIFVIETSDLIVIGKKDQLNKVHEYRNRIDSKGK